MRTVLVAALLLAPPAAAQEGAGGAPTYEELAASPPRFLALMDRALGWQDPAPPAPVVGPVSFVGTRGLAMWVIETSDGLILMNTGMPGSGPVVEASIRALGLDPADVRIILAGHGHVDHVGGHAYMQRLSGAEIAMMEDDADLLETGGRSDFFYRDQPAFAYEPVAVDRRLREGDRIVLGEVALTALATPGHTRGATTFVMDAVEGDRSYRVVFPDGTGVNPGYRVERQETYPGQGDDYRRTFATLELLRPDIWLPLHNEQGDLMAKIARSEAEGAGAFVDPEGYRTFVRDVRAAFEARVDAELARE